MYRGWGFRVCIHDVGCTGKRGDRSVVVYMRQGVQGEGGQAGATRPQLQVGKEATWAGAAACPEAGSEGRRPPRLGFSRVCILLRLR